MLLYSAFGCIAQLVEHWAFNLMVAGSSPATPTVLLTRKRLAIAQLVGMVFDLTLLFLARLSYLLHKLLEKRRTAIKA